MFFVTAAKTVYYYMPSGWAAGVYLPPSRVDGSAVCGGAGAPSAECSRWCLTGCLVNVKTPVTPSYDSKLQTFERTHTTPLSVGQVFGLYTPPR
jgi:hypothetical protein